LLGLQKVPSHLMVTFVSADILIAVTMKITVSFNPYVTNAIYIWSTYS